MRASSPDGAVTLDRATAGRVPVRLLRNDRPADFGACLDQFVRHRCDPGDVVVPLTPADRFAVHEALRHVRAAFADPACAVLMANTGAAADGSATRSRPPTAPTSPGAARRPAATRR
jgi:hypothetical protein